MSEKYQRGKQQILYNYLPGRIFDFGNTASFAMVRVVEGERFDEVNKEPKQGECKCGRQYTVQWFRDGIEAEFIEPSKIKGKGK